MIGKVVSPRSCSLIAVFCACSPAPPAPVVKSVTPSTVAYESATEIEIAGDGFIPGVKTDLDHPSQATLDPAFAINLTGPQSSTATLLQWVDAMHLRARVAAGLMPGTYALQVVDSHGRKGSLENALTVDCTICPDAGPGGSCDAGFLDLDRDGFGDDAGYGTSCEVPRAPVAGDCNVFDRLTHPGAAEVCNGIDDDCNGVIDDGCPDAGWSVSRQGTQAWTVVSMAAPGDPWLAGTDTIGRLSGGGLSTARCDGGWTTGTTDSTGALRLGSAGISINGDFATIASLSSGCATLNGFQQPVQMLREVGPNTLRGVTGSELIVWSSTPQFVPLALGAAQLSAVGGPSLEHLFLGGTSSGSPEAWELVDGGFVALGLAGKLTDPALVAVVGFDDGDAVAVGSEGGVGMYLSGGWNLGAKLPAGDTVSAVWAASPARVYAVGNDALVWRFDGTQWTKLSTPAITGGPMLHAIDATGEEDLWAAGEGGWVLHR